MNFLREFFRTQPDRYAFDMFGITHIFILLITVLGCILIIHFKDKLRAKSKFKNIIAIILLAQQIILYNWYIFSGYNTLREGLPLYNCRVAIISLAVGLLLNNKKLKTLAVYWGGFGTIFALLSPGTDPFSFPHYTKISYFLGHVLLAYGIVYILSVEEFKLNIKNLKGVLIFTNIYHSIVFFIDRIIGANYCYLINSPVALTKMSQFLYTFIVMMVFNLSIIIFYLIISKLSNGVLEENIIEDENTIRLITTK